MSVAFVAATTEDNSFHHCHQDSLQRQDSPRSRSAPALSLSDDTNSLSQIFTPLRKPLFPQKVSSSFCFAFLLFTTSMVFVQLLFLNGAAIITYSPVVCDNQKLQQRTTFPENVRLRFPRTKRRLPQCIIIGARKCGTRALLEFLNLHPMIQKATEEIHFFDDDDKYSLGVDWYRRRMPYSFPGQITVEKSPAYFITPSVPNRIHKMDPNIRLLLIVRDPVTRLISDYAQLASNKVRKDRSVVAFEDLVLLPDGSINMAYKAVRIGMYALYLPRWLRTFSPGQVHVVDGDNLVADPFREVQKIEDFLRLRHRISKSNFYYNETKGFFCVRNATGDKCLNESKGRKHPNVSPQVISALRKFYAPHNRQFFKQARLNFSWPIE